MVLCSTPLWILEKPRTFIKTYSKNIVAIFESGLNIFVQLLHRRVWKGSAKFKLRLCHAIKVFCLRAQSLRPRSARLSQGAADTVLRQAGGRGYTALWMRKGRVFTWVTGDSRTNSGLFAVTHSMEPLPLGKEPLTGTGHVLIWGGASQIHRELCFPLCPKAAVC